MVERMTELSTAQLAAEREKRRRKLKAELDELAEEEAARKPERPKTIPDVVFRGSIGSGWDYPFH